MNRLHITPNPIKLSEIKFDEFNYDNSDGWLQRGRRLQARRWRQLSRQLHGSPASKRLRSN